MTSPISDEELDALRYELEGAVAINSSIFMYSTEDILSLLARLDKAEGELRRISRWGRYGGEDSEPLVYPRDIALAYFAGRAP